MGRKKHADKEQKLANAKLVQLPKPPLFQFTTLFPYKQLEAFHFAGVYVFLTIAERAKHFLVSKFFYARLDGNDMWQDALFRDFQATSATLNAKLVYQKYAQLEKMSFFQHPFYVRFARGFVVTTGRNNFPFRLASMQMNEQGNISVPQWDMSADKMLTNVELKWDKNKITCEQLQLGAAPCNPYIMEHLDVMRTVQKKTMISHSPYCWVVNNEMHHQNKTFVANELKNTTYLLDAKFNQGVHTIRIRNNVANSKLRAILIDKEDKNIGLDIGMEWAIGTFVLIAQSKQVQLDSTGSMKYSILRIQIDFESRWIEMQWEHEMRVFQTRMPNTWQCIQLQCHTYSTGLFSASLL